MCRHYQRRNAALPARPGRSVTSNLIMRAPSLGRAWRGLLLLGLLVLTTSHWLRPDAVQAAPLQQPPRLVQITSPEMNTELRGMVPILGSASIPGFQFYKVEFGIGPDPSNWAVIGLHDTPVINGQLEVWNTNSVPDGLYTLRLHAVRQDGNYDEFVVRQLIVANTRPTSTPTATAAPTSAMTPTPRPTNTPAPTQTLQIISRAEDLQLPTATQTLGRPENAESPLGDTRNLGQSFVTGALAMGIVFVVLGVVFGLRRLL